MILNRDCKLRDQHAQEMDAQYQRLWFLKYYQHYQIPAALVRVRPMPPRDKWGSAASDEQLGLIAA